jgi:hypothetical protein
MNVDTKKTKDQNISISNVIDCVEAIMEKLNIIGKDNTHWHQTECFCHIMINKKVL